MSALTELYSRLFQPREQHLSNRSRTQDLYLQLLVKSILNELYIENDVRLLYIFSRLMTGQPIDTDVVRHVASRLPEWMARVVDGREHGTVWWRIDVQGQKGPEKLDLRNVCEFAHTMAGRKRLENVLHCLDTIRLDGVPGDLAETGVWRGGVCILMRGYLAAWDIGDKCVWVADSFEGMPKPSFAEDIGQDGSADVLPILAVPLEEVEDNFRRYGLLDERVRFLKGWFRDTLPTAPIDKLALLRLDGDLYESTMDSLDALYHKVVPGGFVIVDDYGDFEPCRKAVHQFRDKHSIHDPITPIDWSACYWRKSG